MKHDAREWQAGRMIAFLPTGLADGDTGRGGALKRARPCRTIVAVVGYKDGRSVTVLLP
jgi:hypothetical protein